MTSYVNFSQWWNVEQEVSTSVPKNITVRNNVKKLPQFSYFIIMKLGFHELGCQQTLGYNEQNLKSNCFFIAH